MTEEQRHIEEEIERERKNGDHLRVAELLIESIRMARLNSLRDKKN